ncbi:Uma2 family endonuclease [Allosalinactinospora lopnorensis]|uniref:Uma2 family endonuclease n=1 Tax=Allosalinactinospora lopnorensis TaxID=1352348 RepID=UPI000696B81D|nr:Uma2 family endonuclease [Allosalinactinospora lopnorensis]
MPATLEDRPAAAPRHGGLRAWVEHLDVPEGFRAEIIRGTIVMSPVPSFKHGDIVHQIQEQLSGRLDNRIARQMYAVASPLDPDDYSVPDLAIVPEEVRREEGWLVPADAVDLVVEVVSPTNATNDTTVKPLDYAEWGIPQYLLVDPRTGAIRLHWDSDGRKYRAQQNIEFGEPLTLQVPLKDIEIDTSDFPRYEKEKGRKKP